MSLYLILDLGSLIIPLLFSFHPKLRFNEEWPFVLPGIFLSMLFFVLWDIWFTAEGIWGFNEEYLTGLDLFNLPIEEWLFFICIPYASLFTHHCLKILLPSWGRLSSSLSFYIGVSVIALSAVLAFLYGNRSYTFYASLVTIIVTVYALWKERTSFRDYLHTYLIILIPFCIVNGILTGYLTPEPVVWYNDAENMGLRFLTIPLEDFIYNFSLLLLPILISRGLERKFRKEIANT